MDRQPPDTAPSAGVPAPPVALLDAGDGRRLERLGAVVVNRPAPMAAGPPRWPLTRWRQADLRFDLARGWTGRRAAAVPASWPVQVAGLRLEVRPTSSGGVGLYPEHAENVPWLEAQLESATAAAAGAAAEAGAEAVPRAPRVLNLFAHTGLLTLVAARAGAAVTHVDAARGAVAWARANAAANGLAGRPIRWIVDDARSFVEREARRGRAYDGLIVDPPSFGGSGGARFRLRDDLQPLLEGLARLVSPGGFALVTSHATGLDPKELREVVRSELARATGGSLDTVPLNLRAESGVELRLGWAVRVGADGGR